MEQTKPKTTNAERFKRFRRKNKEEYKINVALRKKRARLLLKSNTIKYKEQKKRIEKEKTGKTPKEPNIKPAIPRVFGCSTINIIYQLGCEVKNDQKSRKIPSTKSKKKKRSNKKSGIKV